MSKKAKETLWPEQVKAGLWPEEKPVSFEAHVENAQNEDILRLFAIDPRLDAVEKALLLKQNNLRQTESVLSRDINRALIAVKILRDDLKAVTTKRGKEVVFRAMQLGMFLDRANLGLFPNAETGRRVRRGPQSKTGTYGIPQVTILKWRKEATALINHQGLSQRDAAKALADKFHKSAHTIRAHLKGLNKLAG